MFVISSLINLSKEMKSHIFLVIAKLHYNVTKAELYKNCYRVLKISLDSDQETVRAAYIEIVKRVHPDSGHFEASADKFAEVDNAFRILQEKFAKERRDIRETADTVQEYDIKHTAPQHRQYLSFDGIGCGTPAQRERQYQQSKASKAHGKVVEYRIDKLSASDSAVMKSGSFFKTHAIKTKYGFDRVVEDLIQEAMSKGKFDKLEGFGKPLSHAQTQNPYVDFTEHKINKILMDNGFTPEWITLGKEIRTDINDLIAILTDYRAYLGRIPLTESDEDEWARIVCNQETRAVNVNKKIDKFNLIAPVLEQQMCHIRLNRIADRVLNSEPSQIEKVKLKPASDSETTENKSFLSSFFWWM